MRIDEVVVVLDELAPLRLAASWDNVGLLVRAERPVRRIGLCIDLTEAVLDELEQHHVDLIVAYHPTIFKGLKRLVGRTPTERVVMRVLRSGLHVHAPHTALDAAAGGMGDWLAAALGPAEGVLPIEPRVDDPAVGMGRRGRLVATARLRDLIGPIKRHLGLPHLRIAGPLDHQVSTFAVCPGAGGELFERMGPVDLLLTGELRHHDVLARVGAGTAVVLTDHTNTERGYLPRFAERLRAALPGIEVVVSSVDDDPLTVV
jgi:dinuclear metal center YbgI/SA1388 family protein